MPQSAPTRTLRIVLASAVLALGACATPPEPAIVDPVIPIDLGASAQAKQFGARELEDLEDDHGTDSTSERYELVRPGVERRRDRRAHGR